jgi:hypothetical protein
MADAIKARETDLRDRRARFERKAEAMRSLALGLMEAADLPKRILPDATLTITAGRQSVDVIDVNELPQGYFQTERKADKTAIKKAFDMGETIPGAAIVTGNPTLTIRTK